MNFFYHTSSSLTIEIKDMNGPYVKLEDLNDVRFRFIDGYTLCYWFKSDALKSRNLHASTRTENPFSFLLTLYFFFRIVSFRDTYLDLVFIFESGFHLYFSSNIHLTNANIQSAGPVLSFDFPFRRVGLGMSSLYEP